MSLSSVILLDEPSHRHLEFCWAVTSNERKERSAKLSSPDTSCMDARWITNVRWSSFRQVPNQSAPPSMAERAAPTALERPYGEPSLCRVTIFAPCQGKSSDLLATISGVQQSSPHIRYIKAHRHHAFRRQPIYFQ